MEAPARTSMRQSPFQFPRAYRLKPVGQREDDALSQLRISAAAQFGGTTFWVRPEALKPLRDLHLAADMPMRAG
jgi:hypothetical protein